MPRFYSGVSVVMLVPRYPVKPRSPWEICKKHGKPFNMLLEGE